MIDKRGQVWVETVLYTLIGLSLIALVLSFVLPKINEAKDKSTVEQAINSLSDIDDKINAVSSIAGNKRFVQFTMKRGEIVFDNVNDKIVFTIDGLTKPYSEPDVPVKVGRINILSTEVQKESSVVLSLDYTNIDLTFAGDNTGQKKFNAISIPYQISIENKGQNKIDIVEVVE